MAIFGNFTVFRGEFVVLDSIFGNFTDFDDDEFVVPNPFSVILPIFDGGEFVVAYDVAVSSERHIVEFLTLWRV